MGKWRLTGDQGEEDIMKEILMQVRRGVKVRAMESNVGEGRLEISISRCHVPVTLLAWISKVKDLAD